VSTVASVAPAPAEVARNGNQCAKNARHPQCAAPAGMPNGPYGTAKRAFSQHKTGRSAVPYGPFGMWLTMSAL